MTIERMGIVRIFFQTFAYKISRNKLQGKKILVFKAFFFCPKPGKMFGLNFPFFTEIIAYNVF